MPDIKSVLASYEKTISANDQAGVSSKMFLNNIAKQKQPLKMTLQSNRVTAASRRRPHLAAAHSDSNQTAPHQARSSLNKRLNDAPRSFKGSTDVTITTCPLDDDLDDPDEAAWTLSNGNPFGEDESCHIDDDGFGSVSRQNEDSLNGSFASFAGSYTSNHRHDTTGMPTSSSHNRNTSRSTRRRDLSKDDDEDDGFTVILHGQNDEDSVCSHSCSSRDPRTTRPISTKVKSARSPYTSQEPQVESQSKISKKIKDTKKRSDSSHAKASVAGSSRTSNFGDDSTKVQGSRSLQVTAGGPRGELLASSATRQAPSRSKSKESLGEPQRHSSTRHLRPSSLTGKAVLSHRPGSLTANTTSPGNSRHSRTSVKESDDASCSPKQSRTPSTRGSTNYRRSSIAGRPAKEPHSSDAKPARVTSSTRVKPTSTSGSARVSTAEAGPYRDQGRSSRDKRDDTFRKMLDHSQSIDWDE